MKEIYDLKRDHVDFLSEYSGSSIVGIYANIDALKSAIKRELELFPKDFRISNNSVSYFLDNGHVSLDWQLLPVQE